MDMIVGMNLVICNRGSTPTFECRDRQSIVDISIVSAGLVSKVTNWRVEEKPSLNDHKYVCFSIHRGVDQQITQSRKTDGR